MGRMIEYYRLRSGGYPPIPDAQADSLYDTGNVRVFQQFLVNITPVGDERARVAAEQRANQMRDRVVTGGEDFGTLIRTQSDEDALRAASGILAATTREAMPPGRMSAHLWTLRPDDFSRVFSSTSSAVIFRRVSKAEARDSLKASLAPVMARRADAVFSDSMIQAAQVVYAKDAPNRVRAMAAEPVVVTDSTPLATWQGGEARPEIVRRWILALDPPARVQMEVASDDEVTTFLRSIAQRDLLLKLAQAQAPDTALRRTLHTRYRQVLAEMRPRYGAAGAAIAPEAATALMDSLTMAFQSYSPMPRGLAGYLRTSYPVVVHRDVLEKVVVAAAILYAERRATDTTQAGVSGGN